MHTRYGNVKAAEKPGCEARSPRPAARGPLPLTGHLAVHDPALVVTEQGWYVVGTGDRRVGDGTIPVLTSPDGLHWTRVGTVWDTKPGWLVDEVPRVDNLWAPEVYHDPAWIIDHLAAATAALTD